MITKLLFASPLWGLIMMAMASVAWAEPATGLTESPLYSSYTDQIVVQPALSAKVAQEKDYWSAVAGVEVEPLSTKSGDRLVLKLADKVSLVDARGIAARLLTTPGVLDAEPDVMVTPAYQPNDPLYPYQWHYLGPPQYPGGANLPPAWDLASGAGVVVAVLDSGITSHPDLAGQTWSGYDFFADDADPADPDGTCSWHGGHVAGTIAAATNNGLGVAGVAREAKLLPVRIVGNLVGSCGGYLSDLIDGLRWSVGLSVAGAPDNLYPARVLNLSLGAAGSCSTSLQAAINEAVAAGAVVTVAAGNHASDASGSLLASCNNVVVVGASDKIPDRASFSNYGTLVDLSAPGVGILSTYGADSYSYYSGTSMAAPHVAGTAALLLADQPQLTPAAVEQALVVSARPFKTGTSCGSGGSYAGLCGAGVLDGYAALIGGGPINQPPVVTITAPVDNSVFYSNQTINFAGTVTDPEDGDLSANLSWYSDLEGTVIGTGSAFSTTLSVGSHIITASVVDSGGRSVAANIRVTVEASSPITVTFVSNGTYDGWVLESSENANVGGSMKAKDTSNKGLLLGDDNGNRQYKSLLSFDTSSIPDSAIIESATLWILRGTVSGTNPFSTHGLLKVDIRTGGFNGNLALEAADFQAPATATEVASLSDAAANNTWSEGNLNSNGLAAINKVDVTQFRLYFSLDDNNDKGADYLGYYAGEYGTAASRPQLVVTYRE